MGEAQTLARGLQHPEAQFYIKTKVIATKFSTSRHNPYRIPSTQLWSRSQCRVWCCSCCRRATHGVAGMVVALRGCRRCRRCAMHGIAGAVIVLRWCCCCRCYTVHGVMVAVTNFVPRVVSRSRLLCCVWCCSRGHCAVCVSQVLSLCHVGVAVAVVAPRVVSRSWSLHHLGVVVAVFAPCVASRSRLLRRMGVVGALVAPRVVLQSQLLCHVGVAGAIVAPHVVLRSRSLYRVGVMGAVMQPRGARQRDACGCKDTARWGRVSIVAVW